MSDLGFHVVEERVADAPDRRIFHIDIGDMPVEQAIIYIETIKAELIGRRLEDHNDR